MSSPHRPDAEAFQKNLEARAKLWLGKEFEIRFIDAHDELARKANLLTDPTSQAALRSS